MVSPPLRAWTAKGSSRARGGQPFADNFWRIWKDYNYVGIHADAVFFFGGSPAK